MFSQYEADIVEKGIEISWTTWSKMRGEVLISGDISYLKAEDGKGFERIFSIKIDDAEADYRIEKIISDMKTGIIPNSMLITPKSTPIDLVHRLSKRGFRIDNSGSCMMMYLNNYIGHDLNDTKITILKITNHEQLRTWLNIVNIALFECEIVSFEQLCDVYNLSNTSFYLGLFDGKHATACMTITEGDTSVLEMVATMRDYRGKGLATAVINRTLLDLKRNGIFTISLRAESEGVGVYKKLGFKDCFKRVVATFNI